MKIREIIKKMEDLAPLCYQEDWDNSGYQIDLGDKDISSLVLTLDVTKDSLDFAKEKKAGLIISHHPLIFSPLNSLRMDDHISGLTIQAIENGISIYASHTSLDACKGGVNAILADKLSYGLPHILLENEYGTGIGRYGDIEGISLEDLGARTAKALGSSLVYYGDPRTRIRTLAVSGGSGGSMIDLAIEKGVDCLITGDIKHHDQLDALANGLAIIDAGHYPTEAPVLYMLKDYLNQDFDGKIFIYKEEKRPNFVKIDK